MNSKDNFFDSCSSQIHEINMFKEKARRLFEHVPAMVVSSKGEIKAINEAAEAIIGSNGTSLIGKTIHKAGYKILDDNGQRMTKADQPWIHAIETDSLVSNVVVGILMPDSGCQWIQVTSMPLRGDDEAKPHSSISILTNITKYKQSQVQLMQSQKMEAIGSLASGLAHDFNNILTSIRAAAQLLLIDRDEKSEDYEVLKDVENETMRGAELIRQLLLFSKPSQSKTKTTNLNERISQLRKLLRRTIPKTIKIELHLSGDEILASIDPTQLEQVILNLSINARHAMPSGGNLKLNTSLEKWTKDEPGPISNSEEGQYAKIEVIDNGVGIPRDKLPRIFEPFYTSKEKSGGTGLGLSIVYAIVHRFNGYILVDSAPSAGTKFTIYIPARRKAQRKTSEAKKSEVPCGGHETILIVDDEQIITRSTARFLERYGYKTMTAFDGKKGLEAFKAHKDEIDLVLLDMEMPEMNGEECLGKILETKPSTKVITLSGHIIKPGEWQPDDSGAAFFIQKPFDSNDLLKTIREILNH